MQVLSIKGNKAYLTSQEFEQINKFIKTNDDSEIHIFDDNFALRETLIRGGIKPTRIVMVFSSHYPLLQSLQATNYNIDFRFTCPVFMTSKMVARPDFAPIYSFNLNCNGSSFQFNYDYVRYGTLTLLAEEVSSNQIDGDIAELGVFRGEFSAALNTLLPDKTLHMFDTFEGFDKADVEVDRGGGYSDETVGHFGNTSIDFVMKRMPHPEKCIVHKGYFPDTAPKEEIKYAFVSIDCDLYAPILAGIKYFYPRLSKGGYIMLHDYNVAFQKGVHKAVADFENEQGEKLHKFPIPDEGGTLVISK